MGAIRTWPNEPEEPGRNLGRPGQWPGPGPGQADAGPGCPSRIRSFPIRIRKEGSFLPYFGKEELELASATRPTPFPEPKGFGSADGSGWPAEGLPAGGCARLWHRRRAASHCPGIDVNHVMIGEWRRQGSLAELALKQSAPPRQRPIQRHTSIICAWESPRLPAQRGPEHSALSADEHPDARVAGVAGYVAALSTSAPGASSRAAADTGPGTRRRRPPSATRRQAGRCADSKARVPGSAEPESHWQQGSSPDRDPGSGDEALQPSDSDS